MSTKIRLSRAGAKKRPYYRVVVADVRSPRDGKFIERVGSYNPLLPKTDPNRVKINAERIKYWLDNGAQPTERVARFLRSRNHRHADATEQRGKKQAEGQSTGAPEGSRGSSQSCSRSSSGAAGRSPGS